MAAAAKTAGSKTAGKAGSAGSIGAAYKAKRTTGIKASPQKKKVTGKLSASWMSANPNFSSLFKVKK